MQGCGDGDGDGDGARAQGEGGGNRKSREWVTGGRNFQAWC
jgi:hypothetical protein